MSGPLYVRFPPARLLHPGGKCGASSLGSHAWDCQSRKASGSTSAGACRLVGPPPVFGAPLPHPAEPIETGCPNLLPPRSNTARPSWDRSNLSATVLERASLASTLVVLSFASNFNLQQW